MLRLTYMDKELPILTVTIPDDVQPMVGREDSSNELTIHHKKVSRIHARIIRDSAGTYVQDFGSRFGTFVDGVKVEAKTRVPLADGALVKFGDSTFKVSLGKWKYEETQSETMDIRMCMNTDCRYPIERSFLYCPHCGTKQ